MLKDGQYNVAAFHDSILSDQAIFELILFSLILALKTPGDRWIPVWALMLSTCVAFTVRCVSAL